MTHNLIQRTVAICLAASLTLAMLGGIDHLAQRDDAAPQWAATSGTVQLAGR